MKSFYRFICENRAQKTLDWMKSQKHNEMSDDALKTHDYSMYTTISNHHDHRFVPNHHLVIDKISKMDPSDDKIHTQALHNWWASGDYKLEDRPRVEDAMSKFITHKNELGNTRTSNGKKGSDINAYGSFHELERHIEKHIDKSQEQQLSSKPFFHPNAEEIYNKNGLIVHQLHTQEASKATRYPSCGGRKNQWCTSRPETREEHELAGEKYHSKYEGTNLFHDYHDRGPLYHIQTPDGKRWQLWHNKHDEEKDAVDHEYNLADHNDKMHSASEFVENYPEIKKVHKFSSIGGHEEEFPFKNDHAHEVMVHHLMSDYGPENLSSLQKRYVVNKTNSVHHLERLGQQIIKDNDSGDSRYQRTIWNHNDRHTMILIDHKMDTKFGKTPIRDRHDHPAGSKEELHHLWLRHDHYRGLATTNFDEENGGWAKKKEKHYFNAMKEHIKKYGDHT